MSIEQSDDAIRDQVRAVHRTYPTGVAVVTTAEDGAPYGLACNAFSSVSLDPPLVLVCVNTSSQTHEHLHRGLHLGINFLAHDQIEVANRFAKSGGDKFSDTEWSPGQTGVPVLHGVSSHVETEINDRIPAGTHTIFLCRVLAAASHGRPPLVYLGGGFYDGDKLVPLT